jgi:hypothetical protein
MQGGEREWRENDGRESWRLGAILVVAIDFLQRPRRNLARQFKCIAFRHWAELRAQSNLFLSAGYLFTLLRAKSHWPVLTSAVYSAESALGGSIARRWNGTKEKRTLLLKKALAPEARSEQCRTRIGFAKKKENSDRNMRGKSRRMRVQ